MAQNQAVIALDKAYPGVMDPQAIVKRMLKQMKVPNIKELMPHSPEPIELNAAEENVAMSLGRAAFAYPYQNHLAHLQTHLDYAQNPIYGTNPLIAPSYMPNAMEHIKQHLVLWYSQHMKAYVQESMGGPVEDYSNPEITGQIDKLFALSSQATNMDAQQVFSRLLPVIQHMAKQAAQYAPQPRLEGSDQVLKETSMAETQRRAQRDQMEMDLKGRIHEDNLIQDIKEQQVKVALNSVDNLTNERIKSAEISHDAALLQQEQEKTALSVLQEAQSNFGDQNGQGSQGPTI
jgi:hypothetical protein